MHDFLLTQLAIFAFLELSTASARLVMATLHVVYISLVMHAALVAQALRALSIRSL